MRTGNMIMVCFVNRYASFRIRTDKHCRGSFSAIATAASLRFGLQLLLLLTCCTAFGARTWYVNGAATGANNGTNWANAWTDLAYLDRTSNNIAAGDTVFISGFAYPNAQTVSLTEGTAGNWTHYYFTNGLTTIYRGLLVRRYTEVNGAANPGLENNIVSTYDVQNITTNCNLWINRITNFYNVGSVGRSINCFGAPVTLKWIHITGCTNIDPPVTDPTLISLGWTNKSDSASEISTDVGTSSSHSEYAYIWIDQSSGHGAGAAISVPSTGTEPGCFNIHHCLIEHGQSDICNASAGLDFHHNIIRNRSGPYGGCNDTFTLTGDTSYIRIHHNLIEPGDNTLYYLWGAVSNIHDFYFYGNVLTPVRPQYAQQYSRQGSGIMEQDVFSGALYYIRSNVVFANNTWIGTTNRGPSGLISFISKNTGPTGFSIDNGAMVIKNNLFVDVDTTPTDPNGALGFYPNSTAGYGTNIYGAGWSYTTNSIVLDFNQFWSYYPGNLYAARWGAMNSPLLTLNSAADIAFVMGYQNNVSGTEVTFMDAQNYDYRPASAAVKIAQDLGSLTNLMPDLDKDIFGQPRGQNGTWSAGAIEYAPITPTAPSILVQPFSQTNGVGSNVTFAVGATGTAPLSYQWSLNGTAVAGATGASYTVMNITTNDAGSYTVVVSNAYGAVSSSVATLAVTLPTVGTYQPVITGQPGSQFVVLGNPATFTVGAAGTSPLSYQWSFNGTTIGGATQASYTVANSTTNDAGGYSVVVTNAYGSATSQAANLTVRTLAGPDTNSVTNGLVLWLTFDQSDGWTTNHVITDKSGLGNHAYYMPSTNRNTWPTWTNGPNGLSAAQFVVNYTNAYRYGTYAAITSLSTNAAASGLAWFTNGTWACWASIDGMHLCCDSGDDMFLSTGQETNNWFFGKYYSDGPQFSRDNSWGGQEPLETYTRWPNVTSNTWAHYAITWDGTNWLAYLNGALWTNSAAWTNNNTFVLTNKFTGTLVSTNSVGGIYNWIAVGVNSHSGTANPDDADGLPNNGQLWGQLSDIRIYNRALSTAEIGAIYSGSATGISLAPPANFRVIAAGP